MIFVLLLGSLIVSMVLLLLRPKWAAILIWPVLLVYPNNLWNKAGIVPLQIGYDNLFIAIAFVAVILRHSLGGGRRPAGGFAFKAILAYFIIALISNVSGYVQISGGGPYIQRNTMKDVLKLFGMVMLTYTLVNVLETPRDLRNAILAMVVGMTLASITAIVSHFRPSICNYFWDLERLKKVSGVNPRATGSLMVANTLGGVMNIGILSAMISLKQFRQLGVRVLIVLCMGLMLTSIVLSRSRGGFIVFGILVFMTLFSRERRKWALGIIALGIISIFVFPDLYQPVWERFSEFYDPVMGGVGTTVTGRFVFTGRFITSLDALGLLFGRGQWPCRVLAESLAKPHNGYVNLLAFYGIWGIVWFLVVWVLVFKRAWFVRKFARTKELAVVGTCSLFMFVLFSVMSSAGDTFTNDFILYILWMYLVLVDRASVMVRSELEEYHAEYPVELPLVGVM